MKIIKVKKKLTEIIGIENDYFRIEDIMFHHFKWEATIKIIEKSTQNIKYIDLILADKLVNSIIKAKRKLLPYGFVLMIEEE